MSLAFVGAGGCGPSAGPSSHDGGSDGDSGAAAHSSLISDSVGSGDASTVVFSDAATGTNVSEQSSLAV